MSEMFILREMCLIFFKPVSLPTATLSRSRLFTFHPTQWNLLSGFHHKDICDQRCRLNVTPATVMVTVFSSCLLSCVQSQYPYHNQCVCVCDVCQTWLKHTTPSLLHMFAQPCGPLSFCLHRLKPSSVRSIILFTISQRLLTRAQSRLWSEPLFHLHRRLGPHR